MPKVKADFLGSQKASIEVELAKLPVNVTHETALTIFRNAVNSKFPPTTSVPRTTIRRNVRQVQRKQGKRINNQPKQRSNEKRKRHPDSEYVKIPAKDGMSPYFLELSQIYP